MFYVHMILNEECSNNAVLTSVCMESTKYANWHFSNFNHTFEIKVINLKI
jgi:hypothetical protein